MFGLSVAGNWVMPIVSDSGAAPIAGDDSRKAIASAGGRLRSHPPIADHRRSRETFVGCTERHLKRLKVTDPGHIIRWRRGRIRDTESCVFAGTKYRRGCFRPEVREGRLARASFCSVLFNPELPQRIEA